MRAGPLELALLLAGCGVCPADGDPRAGRQSEIRAEQAFVVPPGRLVPAGELAQAVRAAGYPCQSVTAFGQLEFKGKALDNFKLDCGSQAYLLTWLDGGSRIRPWPGGTDRTR